LAPLHKRTVDVEEERRLAVSLAGSLFLTGGVTAILLLYLPGVESDHWPWVLGLAGACMVWAMYCLTLARPDSQGPLFWHLPAAGSLAMVAGVMAATGGAASPARFYTFFVLFYVCYFYPAREAWWYLPACLAVALSPLLHDRGAVGDGYLGEVIVICPAYVTLGWLIIRGKALLVDLREQARALSLCDPLTELPNRRALLEWLRRHMNERGEVGLMLVDLDGFKDVNTVHGYPAGDAVLRETARTLQGCVRSDDFVARLGGDEFALLTPQADAEAMGMLSGRVLDAVRGMEERLNLDEVTLTASVGWVMYPSDAETIDELIAAADFCMRGAKLTGKDRALSAVDWAPEAA
jgi:diguanylate cyclase (GGDEF)-like protein